MKKAIFLPVIINLLLSCNNSNKEFQNTPPTEEKATMSFFPVTSYIKGQISEIKSNGINPLQVTLSGKRIDSIWLKVEEFDNTFKEFIIPVIDSNNLLDLFIENTFADQTLDSYTFTYTPKNILPDSISIQRWDVHISPNNNKVKRIFIVKQLLNEKELQLTWQSDKWCKTTCIAKDKTGKQFVEYEQTIKWDFN